MKLFYKIGEFAKLCGCTVKTLRHYESMGLLTPAEVDEDSGYRYYHAGQLQRMEQIRVLKRAGLSLEEVGDLLESQSQKPSMELLEEKIRQAEAQMAELEDRKRQLLAMADSQKTSEQMNNIYFESLPSIVVAAHRARLDSYEDLGPLCVNVIGPEMARIGCQCPAPGYCFTWEPTNQYREHDIDIEYCEQVERPLEDTEIIKFRTLDAVPSAICIKAYGPYSRLYQHYLDLFAHIEKEHYRITGAPRANYVDGPWNEQDPEKWLTIIQVPVEKKRAERAGANRLRLFGCSECGNVAFAYGKASMECCGSRLEPLPVEDALDEERYKASEFDGEYLLEYAHPMTKGDYICAVVVERLEGTTLYRLYPEQEALVRIPMLPGSKIYTVIRKEGRMKVVRQ